jgi:hypothetical protein
MDDVVPAVQKQQNEQLLAIRRCPLETGLLTNLYV